MTFFTPSNMQTHPSTHLMGVRWMGGFGHTAWVLLTADKDIFKVRIYQVFTSWIERSKRYLVGAKQSPLYSEWGSNAGFYGQWLRETRICCGNENICQYFAFRPQNFSKHKQGFQYLILPLFHIHCDVGSAGHYPRTMTGSGKIRGLIERKKRKRNQKKKHFCTISFLSNNINCTGYLTMISTLSHENYNH